MSQTLSQRLVLQCLDARGRNVDLPAVFAYDTSDPWAVTIIFGRSDDQVRWVIGRDLLRQGVTDPAGEGDVTLWPSIDECGRAAVVMELCSPGGRLVTQLHTSELSRFLDRTLAAVPAGTETVDLDQLVEARTGQSQPE
jgi:hypothetical protein